MLSSCDILIKFEFVLVVILAASKADSGAGQSLYIQPCLVCSTPSETCNRQSNSVIFACNSICISILAISCYICRGFDPDRANM